MRHALQLSITSLLILKIYQLASELTDKIMALEMKMGLQSTGYSIQQYSVWLHPLMLLSPASNTRS